MISRRNYLIIAGIMAIILFLFQFSQIMKYAGNDYTFNTYSELKIPANKVWEQTSVTVGDKSDIIWNDGGYILFVGDVTSDIGSIASQWTKYSKRDICICSDISAFDVDKYMKPEFVIIDSSTIDFEKNLSVFQDWISSGISIVFCKLPDNELIKNNEEVAKFLGIQYIEQDEVTVEGIKLFSGFLLGGETIYQPQKESEVRRQDMDLTMPWYVTAGGTKTYMVGIMDNYYDDYEYKNEYFPAIIWRNSVGDGQVFCVAGDYMSTTSGIGILSAMVNELTEYQVYPIVNAQNTLLVDFPLMSNENDEKFREIYSRSIDSFQSDVIWPTLIGLAEKYDLKYTSFMSPKYNYDDESKPTVDSYNYYLQTFNERKTEVGMSLEHGDSTDLFDKLDTDKEFYDGIEQKYVFTSAFLNIDDVGKLDEALKQSYVRNVRTVACAEDVQIPILDYASDKITVQCLTSNTENLTYTRDLKLKSIETALGYDNAEIVFSEVFWPEDEDDQWQNIYNNMSSALATYWKPFRTFDRTTLTESDQRVRTFLNLDFEQKRVEDVITINVSGRDDAECYFMLRTHGEEIEEMTGGSFTMVEEDAYMLRIDSDTVKITVKDSKAIK